MSDPDGEPIRFGDLFDPNRPKRPDAAKPINRPVPLEDVEGHLRILALLAGSEPETVIADFRHGGALAGLIMKLAGNPPKRGARPNTETNWRRFVHVVIAKRSGMSAEMAFKQVGKLEPDSKKTNDVNTAARVQRSYYRCLNDLGWTDDDVPKPRLADMFTSEPYGSPPPPRRKS